MRLLKYLIPASALILGACSNEEVANIVMDGGGNVHLTVSLPQEVKSRVIGDALASTELLIAVYDADNADNSLQLTGDARFEEGETQAQVNINLTRGKNYQVVFFAASPAALAAVGDAQPVYVFDAENKSLAVNYASMTSEGNLANDYECFYKVIETGVIGSSDVVKGVELSRPVAQINWGTNDIDKPTVEDFFGTGGEFVLTSFNVSDVPSQMDLLTGDMSGSTDIEMTGCPMPSETDGSFPVKDYTYLAMQYILTGNSSETYNLTLSVSNTNDNSAEAYVNEIHVSNAPVQANYQTNIYGSLLSDNSIFTVTKDSSWGGTNPVLSGSWDGKTVTYPSIDDTNKTGTVQRPSDLAGLAAMVAGTNGQTANDFEGYTFTLTDDIDMGGNDFPGIGAAIRNGSTTDDNTTSFKGVFDGGGKTITNLKLSGTDNGDDAVGFIGNLDGKGAALQNVNFSNLQINAPNNEQASVVGLVTNGATVSNVTVESGSISSKEGAAGIVGRVLGSGTIENCTNKADIYVTAKNGAGITGAAYYTDGDMIISNCYNYGNITAADGAEGLGGICGNCAANVVDCVNYGNIGAGNTSASTVGGIVSYQVSCGSIKNCKNYGEVMGSTYVGGILGWVGNIGYTIREVIEITGNTNYGAVSSNGLVAGIMSINRATCILSENTNSAPSITSLSSNAAGILADGFAGGDNTATGGNGYVNYSDNTNTTPADKITGNKTSETFLGTVWMNDEAVTQ